MFANVPSMGSAARDETVALNDTVAAVIHSIRLVTPNDTPLLVTEASMTPAGGGTWTVHLRVYNPTGSDILEVTYRILYGYL